MLTLLVIFCLYITLTNTFLLYAMKKVNLLDNPQYMILACYMVCDLLYFNCQIPVMIPAIIKNSMNAVPVMTCRVFTTATTAFFLACIHLVGLISYERYCYFITPLKYLIKFTKSRIYITVIVICLFSFSTSLTVDLVSPRIPVATTISCQATGRPFVMANMFFFVFFCVPSGSVSVLTLIKLRILMSKHEAEIAAVPQSIRKDQSAIHGLIIKPVKKAVKMVILVSGSFWLTIMPGVAVRFALSASGVTWSDTDYRTSLPLFALSRANYFLIFLVSSFVNPIIYVTVLPEIRNAARKCLGVKQVKKYFERNTSVWPFLPFGYERVHLSLHKVADAPFHIQGNICFSRYKKLMHTLHQFYYWWLLFLLITILA